MRKTGDYQTLGAVRYFVPHSLPPEPKLVISAEMTTLYGEASFALGQLNGMCQKLPDAKRFIKAYVIKEALLSSEIEGIHTTLIDVFTQPLEGHRINKDTQLVINYTHALEAALNLIQKKNLPIATRVILKAHQALMSGGEGEKSNPGNFRKQSVRVGNHVPPPAPEISKLMGDLEKYINESDENPPLIKAGLAHVQFETIHPFLDGNGRIGRLLIVLMLIENGLLISPILYPSYYFKKHHSEYYQRLDAVRTQGDFEEWVTFYLKAIKESAIDAYTRAKEIEELELSMREIIKSHKSFLKMRETAFNALDALFGQPIIGVAEISQKLGVAYNTAQNILKVFVRHEWVTEDKMRKRNKLYYFKPYLDLLEKEYDTSF